MLKELNYQELITIEGGSAEPTPYSVGHDVGKAVAAVLAIIGFRGYLNSLKTIEY